MAKDPDRTARAAARKTWPIRVYRLGEEPPDGLRATTTAAERVEMVWQITLDGWELAGRKIPDYPRSEAPVRVIRSGVRAAEGDEGDGATAAPFRGATAPSGASAALFGATTAPHGARAAPFGAAAAPLGATAPPVGAMAAPPGGTAPLAGMTPGT